MNETDTMLEPLLTYRDLERWLGLSEKSIKRLIDAEGLPAVRMGRAIRFRRREVEAWIENNMTQKG